MSDSEKYWFNEIESVFDLEEERWLVPRTLRPGLSRDLFRLIVVHFFDTMRIPLARGRDFTSHDTADAPWVAVINQTLAHRF